MSNIVSLAGLWFLIISYQAPAQSTDSLRKRIEHIISVKKADIGVSISGIEDKVALTINGTRHFPLQSVFKFHIALVVLTQVDKGHLSLDKKITIEKKDLLPNLYSPIRDKYPNGTTLPLSEILAYTVSESDNVGCDLLLRLLGGTRVVEEFFIKNGFKDISIKINEEVQQANWDLQFQNWTTPNSANEILSAFFNNRRHLLSHQSYAFIWRIMQETKTGPHRLKRGLPTGTMVAHKTGTSGVNKDGISAAVNDIGIITLPNGKHFAISIFVSNSTENPETNEAIIAAISKVSWNYFIHKNN